MWSVQKLFGFNVGKWWRLWTSYSLLNEKPYVAIHIFTAEEFSQATHSPKHKLERKCRGNPPQKFRYSDRLTGDAIGKTFQWLTRDRYNYCGMWGPPDFRLAWPKKTEGESTQKSKLIYDLFIRRRYSGPGLFPYIDASGSFRQNENLPP